MSADPLELCMLKHILSISANPLELGVLEQLSISADPLKLVALYLLDINSKTKFLKGDHSLYKVRQLTAHPAVSRCCRDTTSAKAVRSTSSLKHCGSLQYRDTAGPTMPKGACGPNGVGRIGSPAVSSYSREHSQLPDLVERMAWVETAALQYRDAAGAHSA